MAFPRNEAETIALYRIIQNRIGWRIVESQSNAFPDAMLESDDGERLACEFEHLAKNFHKHGHPIDDSCDLIICWQDDWPESPLPVMALEDCAGEEAKIIANLLKGKVEWLDLHFANLRVNELEEQLQKQKRKTSDIEPDDDYYDNRLEEMLAEYKEKCEELAEEYGLTSTEIKLAFDEDTDDLLGFLGELGGTNFKGCLLLMIKTTILITVAVSCLIFLFSIIFVPIESWEYIKWFLLDLKNFLIQLFS